jgi:hypothetical protein
MSTMLSCTDASIVRILWTDPFIRRVAADFSLDDDPF